MSEHFIYGIHAVGRRLDAAAQSCKLLYCLDNRNSRLRRLIDKAASLGIEVRFEDRAELTRLAGTDKHQGCVLDSENTATGLEFADLVGAIHADSLLLVLDGVQDPHNLGACLRSADACGVDAVIIPRDRSAGLNPTVSKVAAGAAESVPLISVTNLARSLAELQQAGVWLYGAADDADGLIYDHRFEGPVALVLGGEGKGLRRLTREACDHLVALPMLGRVESLNVSVASGVCLYEILRSRGKFGKN